MFPFRRHGSAHCNHHGKFPSKGNAAGAVSRWVGLGAILCLFWALPSIAQTKSEALLKVAADLADEAYYTECAAKLEEALASPAPIQARKRAYQLLAICAAGSGDKATSQDAWIRHLVLDPGAKPAANAAPKEVEAFQEAKWELESEGGLSVQLISDEATFDARVVRIAVNDPVGMVHTMTWRAGEPGETVERGPKLRAARKMELRVPLEVPVTVVGLDRGGAEVVHLRLSAATGAAPEVEIGPQYADVLVEKEVPAEGEKPPEDPLWTQPWFLGTAAAVGVLAVGGGVTAAVLLTPRRHRLQSEVVIAE